MASVANSNFTSIEDSVYTAFTACSVGSGFFLDQNGPEPASPYCSIFVISETPLGNAQESTTINKTTRQTYLTQSYEGLVRFVFTGKDKQYNGSSTTAANYAEDFAQKLRSRYHRLLFTDNGLSVLRVSPLRRAQQKRDTDIYSTYSIDVTLAYDKTTLMTYSSIDHGEINGTLTEAANTTADITITY